VQCSQRVNCSFSLPRLRPQSFQFDWRATGMLSDGVDNEHIAKVGA
jgi:hypothetical protein